MNYIVLFREFHITIFYNLMMGFVFCNVQYGKMPKDCLCVRVCVCVSRAARDYYNASISIACYVWHNYKEMFLANTQKRTAKRLCIEVCAATSTKTSKKGVNKMDGDEMKWNKHTDIYVVRFVCGRGRAVCVCAAK